MMLKGNLPDTSQIGCLGCYFFPRSLTFQVRHCGNSWFIPIDLHTVHRVLMLLMVAHELIAGLFVAIADDQNLISLLKSVNLVHLVERCGGLDAEICWDWNDILTPGEAQRLSILRALYHRPLLTFLDEATSAMGTDYEMSIYKHLLSSCTTIVSVGHRHSIRQFHDMELHFTGDGHYSIAELSASKIRL
ncbi:hypothetical protein D918_09421 [Trichuris suis]|nr:hypothetical protein D918_09421 [Trichuris suis]